ncbi:MAG: hypothetical protein P8Y70_14390, partial [Candidatus Lokiarchaeota archaeon]
FLISLLGSLFNMMVFAIFFWIPASILWAFASRNVEHDMFTKSRILTERRQVTLIDFIFELEIQMDRALQKIQDSKYYIIQDKEKFLNLIDDAIKILKFCEKEGESRSITKIEEKARETKDNIITIREQAKDIYNKLKNNTLTPLEEDRLNEDLRLIKLRIDEFDKSTFGTLQTYYEDAYLKIVEGMLMRKRNIIKSLSKVKEAIAIYNRVKIILQERVENVENKSDLSEEEELTLKKETELLERCNKAVLGTTRLNDEIESILLQLAEQGIAEKNLIKIAELTSEYNVDLYDIILDTFGQDRKARDRLKSILKKIDKSFNEYEKWKNVDFAVF